MSEEISLEVRLWKKRRLTTYITFLISNFLLGMEYSLTLVTLWLYLTDLMKAENTELFYNLISSAYLISGITLSVALGRVVDNSQNIKWAFFFANTSVIIGNLLYIMHFNPWFPFFGRFISGMGILLRPVTYGETAKCYRRCEIQSKYLGLGIVSGLGELFGPTFNMLFRNIEFSIGPITVNYLNIPGLYMALFFLLSQLASFFILHNISKEYEEQKIDLDIKNLEHQINYEEESALTVVKHLVVNSGTSIIILASFYSWFTAMLFDLWVPILVIETMHWTYTTLSLIFTGKALISGSIFVIFILFHISDNKLYFFAIFSLSSIASAMGILLFLKLEIEIPHDAKIVFWVIYCCCYAFVVFLEFTYLPNVFAKLVLAKNQTFSEGLRSSTSMVGALCARLIASYLYLQLQIVGPIMIVLVIVLVVLFITKQKLYRDPYV